MIEFEGLPELVDPVLIAAFEGWNDAGEASSGVLAHLESEWKATPLVELDPEDYYDFQVTRPVVELGDGVTRSIVWPTTRLLLARPPGAKRDVVLLRGIEPNMRWRSFCAEIVGLCHDLGIELAILLGALLNDSPHTRPVPITGSVSDPGMARALNLELTKYEGPTGIVGVLQHTLGTAGLRTVSLWASVPHYVAQPPNPKATLALLRRIEDMLDIPMPYGDLAEEARAWEHGVDELAAQDSEVAEYVRELEERKDAAELPEASGDAIAAEFERYLRRRDRGTDR
ncbi:MULTISPECIES: PAC2 family protein [Microbispora]|uniref:PAC2 family protein n=2 Tax=Microbispora TaxID=2005 RepID=A0A544YXJ5_9ACTN|nr:MULTISPECIES: PAC2 family protein [Microbispora]NJP25054.1 PAC2 family protein [Microbispora sp. CL1-1]MBE3011288.1 PAC2 family protein [Microbispora sitophila]OPG12119.1 carboxylate--amine ligase [Microbispora sp. GKU 823]TQS13972.1 PAC2 family protein [Microbispora sp. SCL1-1]TQS21493.1 PAC2 family protein [Microbispora hainanensis]